MCTRFIVSIAIFLWKTVYCENYCAVCADNPTGLFIYQPKCGEKHCGKDNTYSSFPSIYAVPVETLNFKNISGWLRTNSLEKNIVDGPVLDERWESFLNNHDATPQDFQKVLKDKHNASLFLSVRVHNISNITDFSEAKWYHLKSNTSGIYNCENYSCEARFTQDTNVSQFFDKHNRNIWKIHKYDYLYTTNESQEEVIIYNNERKCTSHNRCFFIYLAMCKNCKLILKILSQDNDNLLNYTVQGEGRWTRTNYCVQNISNCYKISVQTYKNSSVDGFWALHPKGHVVEQPNDNYNNFMRYINVPDDSYECQDVLNQNLTLSLKCSKKIVPPEMQSSYWWYLFGFLSAMIMVTVTLTLFVYGKMKKKILQSDEEELLKNNSFEDPYFSVKRLDFPKYVQQESDSQYRGLRSQFSVVCQGYLSIHKDGTTKENQDKNRFPDIVPYDKNRVRIKKKIAGKYFKGDYINASYIQGANGYREYIIAQNPQKNTVDDFWLMIWQENIRFCVMITQEDEKYCRYWPQLFERDVTYAGLQITLEEVRDFKFYEENKIHVRKKNEDREIVLLHYSHWDEEELNSSSRTILSFVNHLQKIPHYRAPVLFHCLDGTGRSGTVLLCDIVLRSLPITGVINVYQDTLMMIRSRINAISNLNQYILAHLIIKDSLKKF